MLLSYENFPNNTAFVARREDSMADTISRFPTLSHWGAYTAVVGRPARQLRALRP